MKTKRSSHLRILSTGLLNNYDTEKITKYKYKKEVALGRSH